MPRPDASSSRSRNDTAFVVKPSLVDRLVDEDRRNSVDPPITFAQSARNYRASVRRDLEWLLNTRASDVESLDELPELARSVFRYGLPDFSAMSIASSADRESLKEAIRLAIEIFEPRLKDVEVQLQAAENKSVQGLRFTISAVLQMEHAPEQVTFDTLLDVSRGEYSVREG